MDIFDFINESRTEKASGSKSGRSKGLSGKKGGVKSEKSRVKVYDGILDALKKGYPGQIFTTKNADRLYVITKGGWGKDKDQRVAGKTAKGFTPGSATPGSSFKDIKGYATRTMVKHGKSSTKRFKGEKYFKGGAK